MKLEQVEWIQNVSNKFNVVCSFLVMTIQLVCCKIIVDMNKFMNRKRKSQKTSFKHHAAKF